MPARICAMLISCRMFMVAVKVAAELLTLVHEALSMRERACDHKLK